MKVNLIVIIFLLPVLLNSQTGITFHVEDLDKPKSLLETKPYNKILEELIKYEFDKKTDYEFFSDSLISKGFLKAHNKNSEELVNFGYHSFYNGLYDAYINHRPFVISPDMIWLLISQGFAKHIGENSDFLRKYFVKFDGKLTLVVRDDRIQINNPDSPWEEVFPQFTEKISEHTGKELIELLTCDFTTTTPSTKVASEITIMKAMEKYFEYIVMYFGCGIPEITLEGTPEDWQKVLDKTNKLRKYEFDWWIDELEPVLEEFVDASKGDISKRFWRKMFKYHEGETYKTTSYIDGWIIKFFPYNKDGKRNDFEKLYGSSDLPDEIVKVDLKLFEIENGLMKEYLLELWAGFVGLKQNSETFALRPEIGWMIRLKDTTNLISKGLDAKINKTDSGYNSMFGSGISIRVNEVPDEILGLEKIDNISIEFTDRINIPDEMGKIQIKELSIKGNIDIEGIESIKKMFPNTKLRINNIPYSKTDN